MKDYPVVVVTGASSGIGAAIARRFGRGQFRIVLLARRLDRLEEMRKEIGERCSIYPLDVTERDQVAETLHRIEKELGSVHLLVNNAGGAFGMELAQEAKLDDWDRCIDINIKGLVYCTREILPFMVRRKSGHIINLGSIAGLYPYPGGNVYGATKAFVHQFSLNLRADLLGTNVRVSCIEPGMVGGTEFSDIRFRGDRSKAQKVYEGTMPLTPEDIAEVVYFCHTLPAHVNINTIELMPVMQASGPLAVYRAE